MKKPTSWSQEFARVIACTRCSLSDDVRLVRDEVENVPQPGWIGRGYEDVRLLLVGQNPGTPKSLAAKDLKYTDALRKLRDAPTDQKYQELVSVLQVFIPQWPVHGSYFPLAECDLILEDIGYCNLVRCRTQGDSAPTTKLVSNCTTQHFSRWLDLLQPKAVVFIGKWAAQQGGPVVAALGIPYMFMNRQRSLSSQGRIENRKAVVKFVREKISKRSPYGTK